MRKILIISFYAADKNAIGSVRINGLVKFLPRFGWKPFILTAPTNARSESEAPVFEAPYEDLTVKWKRRFGLETVKGVKEQLNLKTHKHDQDFVDLLANLWYEIIAYPDIFSDWRHHAVEEGDALIADEGFDAMISSGPPWREKRSSPIPMVLTQIRKIRAYRCQRNSQ